MEERLECLQRQRWILIYARRKEVEARGLKPQTHVADLTLDTAIIGHIKGDLLGHSYRLIGHQLLITVSELLNQIPLQISNDLHLCEPQLGSACHIDSGLFAITEANDDRRMQDSIRLAYCSLDGGDDGVPSWKRWG